MIITGAAPTSPSVLGFIRAALGCQVSHTHTHTHEYKHEKLVHEQKMPLFHKTALVCHRTYPVAMITSFLMRKGLLLSLSLPFLTTTREQVRKFCLPPPCHKDEDEQRRALSQKPSRSNIPSVAFCRCTRRTARRSARPVAPTPHLETGPQVSHAL